MATVPTSFVPQVQMQGEGGMVPMQAPDVEPMRNFQPEQQIKQGQAMTNVGVTGYRVGSAIQDDIDEAGAKAADVAFQKDANEILRGKDGYFTASGKDAVDRFQSTSDALSQAAQRASDSLANSSQKGMFNPVAQRNLLSFNSQVGDYRNREAKVYAISESGARADAYSVNAVNLSATMSDTDESGANIGKMRFDAALGTAIAEARKVGIMRGFPVDSQQMKDLENAIHTQVTAGVVASLARDDRYADAIALVNEQNEAGHLDIKTAQSMLTSLGSDRERQVVVKVAQSILSGGGLTVLAGTENYLAPIDGAKMMIKSADGKEYVDKGIDIDATPGSVVRAPSDGVIISENSTDGAKTIAMRLRDGTVVTMEGLDKKAFSGALVGASVLRGQAIAASSQSPMHLSMERGGKAFDPRNMNSLVTGENQEKLTVPLTLRDALNTAGEIPNTDTRRAVEGEIRQQWANNQAMANQEYGVLVDKVANYLSMPSGVTGTQNKSRLQSIADLPPGVFSSLTLEDQNKFATAERKTDSIASLYEIDSGQKELTADWLRDHYETLTPETYNRLWNKLTNPKEAAKLASSRLDTRELNDSLEESGLGRLVNATSDSAKSEYRNLRDSLELNIGREQVRLGRSLSPTERTAIVDGVVMSNAMADSYWPFGWGDYEKSIVSMTNSEILEATASDTQDGGLLAELQSSIARAERDKDPLSKTEIVDLIMRFKRK